MSKFIIEGGRPLKGKIRVAGNKNAVLPIMAATLLVSGETILENVPKIRDVEVMGEILRNLGAKVAKQGTHELKIVTEKVHRFKIEPELAKKLRASVLFLGPLLSRFGKVELPHPGGDIIGRRSIETHLDGFISLGASVTVNKDKYVLKMNKARSCSMFLDEPSVTGTENMILSSLFIEGETRIENAASEPHVVDLINFFNAAGAKIEGGGTNTLKIKGIKSLTNVKYQIVPDHIEMGTFAICAAVTSAEIEIYPAIEEHLKMTLLILGRMGVKHKLKEKTLKIYPSELVASRKRIQTGPWPAFPTDLMSSLIVLATQAKGETLCHDPMYESRMFFVDKLIRMGAQITICDPHRVIVYGPTKLIGGNLNSPDIRAGMALVIAALLTEGRSVIENAEIIERGYEDLEGRLSRLGAKIKKSV